MNKLRAMLLGVWIKAVFDERGVLSNEELARMFAEDLKTLIELAHNEQKNHAN